MNRRNFIASSVTAVATLPFISLSATPAIKSSVLKKEETWPVYEHVYELLTFEELEKHGIRSRYYCASVFDSYGVFYHESNYNKNIDVEYFIVKGHRIQCLPIIYSTDKQELLKSISTIDGMSRDIINEVKENMAYVCFVGYALTSNWLNGDETFFVPIMRGLSKQSYDIKVAMMNAKTKEEIELVYKKYNI